MKKLLLSLIICLSAWVQAFPQKQQVVDIYFKIGSNTIDLDFEQNRKTFEELLSYIDSINNSPTRHLSKLLLKASASPDGSKPYNYQLSARRLNALETLIKARIFVPDSILKKTPEGVAWDSLRNIVSASDMAYRQEVLRIIDRVPEVTYRNGILADSRQKHLKELKGGKPYLYMQEHFFPALRTVNAILFYKEKTIIALPQKIAGVQESSLQQTIKSLTPPPPR